MNKSRQTPIREKRDVRIDDVYKERLGKKVRKQRRKWECNVCNWFNRAMAFRKQGKYWEALLSFDKGLALCPDDEDALRCADAIINKLIKKE